MGNKQSGDNSSRRFSFSTSFTNEDLLQQHSYVPGNEAQPRSPTTPTHPANPNVPRAGSPTSPTTPNAIPSGPSLPSSDTAPSDAIPHGAHGTHGTHGTQGPHTSHMSHMSHQSHTSTSSSHSSSGTNSPRRSKFKFGSFATTFASSNEHLINPTFGNGVQLICQNPNLLRLPPGIDYSSYQTITSSTRVVLLSFGFFRTHGVNPNDIGRVLSQYIDCYTSLSFEFNKERIKYHKARAMIVVRPEVSLLTSNYTDGAVKKNVKIRVKMKENDCCYSWYKHNGYDIECGVIGIPKDETSLNRFSKKFQKLKYDFVSFAQIHTKHSSFKSLQCYYLSCVRHTDANLTTCRVEMRGPNLLPPRTENAPHSPYDRVETPAGDAGNIASYGSDPAILSNLRAAGSPGENAMQEEAKREEVMIGIGAINGMNGVNGMNSGAGRRDSFIKKKFKKMGRSEHVMEETVILYKRYKRAGKNHAPNVNENYFWKIGDSIDICIDYDEDTQKQYLYWTRNGTQLIDVPTDNMVENDRKTTLQQPAQYSIQRELETTEEFKDPNDAYSNASNGAYGSYGTPRKIGNNFYTHGAGGNDVMGGIAGIGGIGSIAGMRGGSETGAERFDSGEGAEFAGDGNDLQSEEVNNGDAGRQGDGSQGMLERSCDTNVNVRSAFNNGRIELNTKDYYYYAAITTVGCDCDDMKGFAWEVGLEESHESLFDKKKEKSVSYW